MNTIAPAKNYIFAQVEKLPEKKTDSGIIIPDAIKREENIAKVINVNGNSDIQFEQGSNVIYKSYAATAVKLNDEDYLLLSVFDVLGTVLEVKP